MGGHAPSSMISRSSLLHWRFPKIFLNHPFLVTPISGNPEISIKTSCEMTTEATDLDSGSKSAQNPRNLSEFQEGIGSKDLNTRFGVEHGPR